MKRGTQLLSLETVAGLALAVMVIWVMISYVNGHSDSTGYFQDFYTKDLSLMAEVVTASPGEVVVTYDNLKQGLGLRYVIEKGVVSVFTGVYAEKGYYGTYPRLTVKKEDFTDPDFLTFVKTGDWFLVNSDLGYLRGCELTQKAMSFEPKIIGDNLKALLAGAREVYPPGSDVPSFTGYDAFAADVSNIVFNIRYSQGPNKAIITFDESPEYAYIACIIKNQMAPLALIEEQQGIPGEITITIQKDNEWLDERFLGQMIGRAVLQYDRK
jgi:hypothetical protein